MNTRVGPPEIGQWYARADKGESFQVVARDDESGTIEIQSCDGEVDEIDRETWNTLPLERSEPLEDWTDLKDVMGADDPCDLQTDTMPADSRLE